MPPDINNINKYVSGMAKSLIDKIFFVDKLPDKFVLLDFGCADGFLLSKLTELFPENSYFGYDKNVALLSRAIAADTITYSSDLNQILSSISGYTNTKKVLLLSSVIHEIYSYSSDDEVRDFWKFVFNSDFDYVVIRDMIPIHSINRPSYEDDVHKIYNKLFSDSLETTIEHLTEFQTCWGNITEFKNLTHFLLKYRYIENWKREVRENYLPLCLEDLYCIAPTTYQVLYKEHYCLPFLETKVYDDFGITLREPTHLKLIFSRRT